MIKSYELNVAHLFLFYARPKRIVTHIYHRRKGESLRDLSKHIIRLLLKNNFFQLKLCFLNAFKKIYFYWLSKSRRDVANAISGDPPNPLSRH